MVISGMTALCKAYFQHINKCDVVESNIYEILNALLLKARNKSIITLLKEMRLLVMKREVDR